MSKEVLDKNQIEKQAEKQAEEQAEVKEKKRKDDLEKFSKELNRLETGYVDREVFYEYFGYKMPTEMASKLSSSSMEDNINLVALI